MRARARKAWGRERAAAGAVVLFGALIVGIAADPSLAVSGDDEAPTWPVGSTVSVSSITRESAVVSWDAATDNESVTGYRIFVDGAPVATSMDTTHILEGLSPDTGYSVRIEAFDEEGNESGPRSGLTLSARTDLAMGEHPHSVKAADLDGDGHLDLVVSVAGDDGVSIRLGNGDGSFGGPVVYRSGTTPGNDAVYAKNAVVADLDGDDRPDLVVANQNNDSVGVLLGNGDGTFASVSQYATCDGAHDVAVGDFTSGSSLDIAVSCHGDNVITLLEGDGSGGVSSRTDIPTGAPGTCAVNGRCDHGIVAADLDGPGHDDIAIGIYSPIHATVMLGNGDGTFASPVDYTAGGNTHDIAAGDFDGDGDLDLVTANESSDDVTVFRNNGGGAFTSGVEWGAADGPKGVAVGHLDDDAHLDIVVGSDGGNYPNEPPGPGTPGDWVTVLLGDGDGTFQSPRFYGDYAATSNGGESVFDVAIADLNGDGRGDLLAANWFGDTVSIWFGADAGGPETSFSTAATGTAGDLSGLVDVSEGLWFLLDGVGDVVSSFYFGNPGDVPFVGDWNGDGVETPGLYRQSDGFVYLRNSNTAGVADVQFFFGNPGDVPIAGDFDGDGFDTVSIYRPSNQTFYIINELGSNNGGLGAAEFEYVFGDPGDNPFVGDFDGDGVETVGLHRESTGLVYFRNSHTQGNADAQFIFGDPGDRVIAGDWTGDGVFSPALYRPSDTTMYFRYTNTQGNADLQFTPDGAQTHWVPIAGNR